MSQWLLSKWPRRLNAWWNRRRRFAEEWRFHFEMAASELEALGLSRPQARQFARSRLGSQSVHRRAALREIGADARGLFELLELLPAARLKRSPILLPVLIGTAAGLALALNPARVRVLESIRHLLPLARSMEVKRLIPLTPAGLVPIGFAAIILWTLLLVGLARIAVELIPRGSWRLGIYAGFLLHSLAILGAIGWATGMQVLLRGRWGFDIVQGCAMIVFVFAYAWAAYGAMNFWWRDVAMRCPVCLRLPGMAEVHGKAHDVLIEPLEVESICMHGHGLAIESRWRRNFQCG